MTTSASTDTATSGRTALESFFLPASVAVIGATDREGSVGCTVVTNLVQGSYRGRVYPVNRKHTELFGVPCYPSPKDLPQPADLAVIVTPAATVPGVVRECVDAGVRSAIVISAGFKERGAEGLELERQVRAELRRGSMRLVGPNCLGMMNPWIGLNATFAKNIAQAGNVAFLSQSGALLTAILDWSLQEQVGFSAIVSTGSMLDVNWGDLISFYGEDPKTQSILLYMESIGDARSFLSAAREVALRKPIILIKAGRTEAASKAASSHTGALTGSDEVFDAALRRCGVLRVQNISDLFYMAEVLSKQPRPRGPRLTILTNAGGPGVLATDALIANGGKLAPLSNDAEAALSAFLPPHWSHANPIDILGDADPERYAKALRIAIEDPASDGLLVILAPQGMTSPAEVAKRVAPYAKEHNKPLLASWMGGKDVAKGEAALSAAGVPTFPYPDTAARAFDYMWSYSEHLRGLYETPAIADTLEGAEARRRKAEKLIRGVLTKKRTLLTEAESKELLALYSIPTVTTKVARSAQKAVERASQIGYPVVLKLHSETVTHKTDVGGVKLNLSNAHEVRDAYRKIENSVSASAGREAFQGVTVQPMVRTEGYELILGSSLDPLFGPVLLFGSGGQLVEVYRDHALALPPLNATLAQRLLEQTKIYVALQGVRGRPPVDLAGLKGVLVAFSQLIVDLPRIAEVDINPLLASPDRILALDARVVLVDRKTSDEALPRPAIRPYPLQYISPWTMKDGAEVTIRPIRPEDEPAMAKFHELLSDETVYLRYFHMAKLDTRVAHERLLRKCFIDYDREMALVAELSGADSRVPPIVAVGRLSRKPLSEEAELAVVVADRYQHQGLGGELIARLVKIARAEGLKRIVAEFHSENSAIRHLAVHGGAKVERTPDPMCFRITVAL
ncbi:MAG TPA: bifunctional acetate--CoA ligase family protein/GNAT family N-acetyltransferase [Candidatus Acidoferrum sp.]|nr:bifunctional acetate--CoA ligase family protein/GNAT family N-acetyltransferase [Candidatus Acidoferrum sp.]